MPALTTRPFPQFACINTSSTNCLQALAILYGFHNSYNCLSIGRS